MRPVVTGEAVTLDLRPASFAARAVSLMIDVVAQGIVALALVLIAGRLFSGALDPALGQALLLVLAVTLLVAVPVTVETLTRGKSLGRLVMGLRIVRDDGGSIRFRHAFIRGMLAVLETYLLFGSLAFMVALFNERSKRLGDLLAGTYAIHDRVAEGPRARAEVPPELQNWARAADLGRLPEGLARRLSQFLANAPRLSPQARSSLAAELASETARFTAPAPPEATLPEAFLNAVSAERRRRDYVRLARQKELAEGRSRRLHRLPYGR
jgi:uncharacterized RDD family membrane protein YckC